MHSTAPSGRQVALIFINLRLVLKTLPADCMSYTRYLVLAVLLVVANTSGAAPCNDWEVLTGYKDVFIRDTATDRFGNLYVVGSFFSPNFDIGSTHITLHGDRSLFILKFDKQMSLQWARSTGNYEFAERVIVDKDDNIIVSGYLFSPVVMFDCIKVVNSSRSEIFFVKYASSGYAMWGVATAGLEMGNNLQLSVTSKNELVVSFSVGSVGLQPLLFGGLTIQRFGGFDSVVARLSSSGVVEWARCFGGEGSDAPDYITASAVDSKGNVLLTGFFESPVIKFDSYTLNLITISENYFVTKLDPRGRVLWVKGGESPFDRSGFGITAGQNDDVYVAGRFYGLEAKFGNITLTDPGDGGAFIVQYDSSGVVKNAKAFGGDRFDAASCLSRDENDNLLIAGYFYSSTFIADSKILNKPTPRSDAFVINLTPQLQVNCIKQVSGSAESDIISIHSDKSNNTWMVVRNAMGDGITQFDNKFLIDENEAKDVVVSLGNTDAFDASTPNTALTVNLGNDVFKCSDDVVTLDAGFECGAEYLWSDGARGRYRAAGLPGMYWVEVRFHGKTGRDTVLVQNKPMLVINLGADREICENETVILDLSNVPNATFRWEDGSSNSTRAIQNAGTYSVAATGSCNVDYDSIIIGIKPPLNLNLGDDQALCVEKAIAIGPEAEDGVTYLWNNGSHDAIQNVSLSGTYSLTIENGCEAITDSVKISFTNYEGLKLPNVITPNGDLKNDNFIVPPELLGSAVDVFNRWGDLVFHSATYDNGWSGQNVSAGTYFVMVDAPCAGAKFKIVLQVLSDQ